MRDGGKGDKRRPLVIPEEQFNEQWDAIFNSKKLVEEAPYHPGYEDAAMGASFVETTYVERRVPEHLEDEAHDLIDNWLRSKGYDPEAI
jgi:hypothetical protein